MAGGSTIEVLRQANQDHWALWPGGVACCSGPMDTHSAGLYSPRIGLLPTGPAARPVSRHLLTRRGDMAGWRRARTTVQTIRRGVGEIDCAVAATDLVGADPSRARPVRHLAPQVRVLMSTVGRPDAANAGDHGVQEHTADDPDGRRAAHLARARRQRQSATNWRPEPDADLCDDVIQQLYAIGLAIRTTQRRCDDRPKVAARIADHLNDLQGVIHQIRSTVLDPRPSGANSPAAEPRIPAPHRS